MILLLGQWALQLVENQLAMLLEYAQRRFERMEHRLSNLQGVANIQRVLEDYAQPDAHAWFHRHDAGGSLAADRGTGRARDAGSFRLLPSLARRRCADVGRAGHDAPRSRRLSA